ncbi:MAG: hypothetical protein OXF22_08580 [Anaerolineaceae bacterium]|nr:hypothetical protein [Anaerolineaceae bacterium]
MILNPQDNYLFDTTFFSDLLDGHYFGIKPIDFPALATGLSGYSLITLAEIYVKRLIAATAHAHRLTWFTRDERHGTRFRQAGVSVSTYALTA